MAKVKITGHASGSGVVTVTAPNTSTDRTITLPDATATIATTADVTAATFNPNAAQVFNESGADVDFRVEGSGEANALVVNGANGRVGVGTASPEKPLHIMKTAAADTIEQLLVLDSNADSHSNGKGGSIVWKDISVYADTAEISASRVGGGSAGKLDFKVRNTSIMQILSSGGRVVSQSNAHSWINYDQSGTIVIRDSYNVSSITDAATGYARIYFDVDHAQSYYAVSGMAGNHKRMTQDGAGLNSGYVAIYTQTHSGTATADESRCFVITFGD